MKVIFCILFFIPLCFYSQSKQDNFYDIDSKVESISSGNTDTLAKKLAALGNTEKEKVRAIFRWITQNIDYNVRPIGRGKKTPALFYEEPDDSSASLPPLNERVARKVLYKGVAFCEGYSRLFKTLCDHAGIKSEIIYGYARTNTSRRFGVNHAWNVVYIDSAWHLLDVTWASGVVSFANEYVRQYNNFYFLTPPEEFIRDHYPEDLQWTLLSNPPVYREYSQSPFRYSGYLKAGISNHFPAKGVIDAAVGEPIYIELRSKREVRNYFVSASPILDTTNVITLQGDNGGETLSFKYDVTPATGEWLYVFCNDELAMRYKLNLKRNIAVSKLTGILKEQ
ncbi:MAG TPA: transglutaminase domain-containing protein [Chitinophagaceae bacterium]|nr:transglutaminase domain-containing protein [Chitinophagaceae bacterium]